MTDKAQAYLEGLAEKILALDIQIQRILDDDELAEMERSIHHAELQAKYCYLRQRQAAIMGDVTSEQKWCSLSEAWEGRKKVAVAAREKDLLPKILERLERNQDLNKQLQDLS